MSESGWESFYFGEYLPTWGGEVCLLVGCVPTKGVGLLWERSVPTKVRPTSGDVPTRGVCPLGVCLFWEV